MNLSITIPILMVLFPGLINTASEVKPFEYSLQGIVTGKESGKPLENVYLYAVKGEEEAITNKKGEFKFVTWQKLPFTIHIHYKEENIRILVSNPSEHIKIKL